LITPCNSEPLVAASQDFLTASYLITQRDVFYNRDKLFALVTCFGLAEEQVDIPTPAILKPVPLWTGKQLFSVMIRPNKDMNFFLSFEVKEKNYDSNLKLKHFCPNDGYVCFRNNELISGNVVKKTIGGGSKTGLLYILL